MRFLGILGLVCFLACDSAYAALQASAVEYQDGAAVLEGYLVFDDALSGQRPGVLVVHEWKGLNDYAKRRAEALAQLGYAAFAVDMYGKGIRAKDHVEAAQLSGAYRSDRQLMRARIGAALEFFKHVPVVDATRLAAIGYCFGGTTVLELARSDAAVLGVASFHGGLDTPNPAAAFTITARVLAFHGADDTFISPEQVAAFEEEMKQAHADYRLIRYPGAVHSFTVAEAGNDPSSGMAYNEAADKDSWQQLTRFLKELFEKPPVMRATSHPGVS